MPQDSITGKNFITSTHTAIIDTLRNAFRSFKRNIVLFIVCVIACIGLLMMYNGPKTSRYKASFTVAYDDLVRKIYGDRLYKINVLVGRKEYNKVAAFLGVDVKTASTLKSVKGKNILGEDLTQDMNTDKIPFIIKIEVSDTSNIPALQKGLVNFLEEGNAYSATTKALKVKEIEEELAFIDQQMQMMDSLKRKYNAEKVSNADDQSASVSTVYNFSYELFKKKKELMRKKSMPGTIQVLDDAIAAQKAGWSIPVLIVLGLIIGTLLFAFIVIVIKPVFTTR